MSINSIAGLRERSIGTARSLMAAVVFAFGLVSGRNTIQPRRPCHLVFAWLAAFGLCLQLAASAVCPPTPSLAVSGFNQTTSPICHTQSVDDQTGGGDHQAPDHQGHACPFCSLHCHASMATAPHIGTGAPLSRTVEQVVQPTPFAPRPLSRYLIGASPRGPPTLG